MIPHHVTDGDGPAVVLLNSLGTTLHMWQPQVIPLKERFRLVRFDARGHGRTPRTAGALTVDDLADDVADLLDHLGVARAHLVGASLGGAIAMRLAVREPDRVNRLVLVSTAAKIGTPEGWRARAEAVRAGGCAAVSGPAMSRWFSEAFLADQPDTVAAFRDRFDACDAEGYAACCEAIGGMDLRDQVHRIGAPALVVAGADDEVTTVADAAFLDERIPGARTVLAEGAKHLLTAERADWANRILVEFLDGDPATGDETGTETP
ncbi:3-oxoadipate enol-lactonase [Glycomyces sp. A-F 0318]|uniref:3-oxoadipate enol-lactonase n=1 Tax=Glycomyces amatae TaxID=2881355 RepID=UPI001E607054|nr:3-oxoadipate enol-lactonase [Glycomyces amatae]MCD0447557.1 3-oxoadipate enol-lactonase [Glycomyces amatae]